MKLQFPGISFSPSKSSLMNNSFHKQADLQNTCWIYIYVRSNSFLMMLKLSKVLKILIFFIYVSNGARKVRYSRLKSRKSSGGSPGDPSDVYEFLNRITPPKDVMFELLKEKYQDYAATTTTSTTSTTTTTTSDFTTPSTFARSGRSIILVFLLQ